MAEDPPFNGNLLLALHLPYDPVISLPKRMSIMREAEVTDTSSRPDARVISESSTPNSFPVVSCGVKFPPGMECEPHHYENDRLRDYIIEIRRLIEDEGKVKISSCWKEPIDEAMAPP